MICRADHVHIISLFAGAGGLDLGFHQAGFDISWAIDNDSDAVKTYEKNIGAHALLGDVRDVNFSELDETDGIIGGFPCQGFSLANTGRTVDDSRNTLYLSFVRAVRELKPKFFLAENVKGILSLGKGDVFKHILADFSNAGYACKHALVNASHYGVPQNRQRVLIFGIRNDLDPGDFEWPPIQTTHLSPPTIGAALKSIPDPDEPHDLLNHVYSQFKLKFNGYISNRAVDPEKPSPTITARGDHKGGAMIIHHPSNKRRLTCREAALVQGFPLDYEFIGSMTSVYKQIGNAVPPPLARAAAEHIKKLLG
jgi:DNA (cytosine-5)-methyltransferase 1